MPVKRRQHKARPHRITPEAIAAFEAGDYHALHRALGLAPSDVSPLPIETDALGVADCEEARRRNCGPGTAADLSWHKALRLQRELLAAGAKMPTRSAGEQE